MSDADKLKHLDPEEVFQKTYIPHKVFKKLIEQDFEGLGNRTKVFGLIKILEDRFDLDLSELKESAQNYFQTHQENHHTAFQEEIQSKNKFPVGLIIAAIVVFSGVLFWFASQKNGIQNSELKSMQTAFLDKNVTAQISTEKEIQQEETQKERNETFVGHQEENETKTAISETNASKNLEEKEQKLSLPTVTFIPKKKLWIGIMYLDNYKRKNYITSKPVEIDTSRDQLIMTGHGLFRVDIDGNITDYKERLKMRFLYRAGELEKIDKKTFDLYSKGHKW
ncbi:MULTISPECIES: hypothetical protein [unclassified Nitratiruptor]|uniref:hypothetical protein n=1 Tax=unclassified Nitratiruptor TaxID=2624044 RepID=UPI0019165A01|nr:MULTISPECIES: hypothetical protein [unclassified Nitratiruptor]BCD60859.1 arginine/ornithine antiporter ArcD [Nitratiruptor sp. YY08-10]BCD64791.1 arginine/ornithine antiporter ArcD [Nitratiruptor sp. YY08-14]